MVHASDAQSSGDLKGWIIIIQTRWHEDDLVGRLTDKTNPSYVLTEAKKWSIIDLPAIARDHDPIGRKPGEALWPERFPVDHLEDLREARPEGFPGPLSRLADPGRREFLPRRLRHDLYPGGDAET